MKQSFFQLLFVFSFLNSFSQNNPTLRKSWIKVKIENLSDKDIGPDTLYTRYTFNKSDVRFSFYPGWDDYKQTWSHRDENLTIGFDTYKIEELTDTSLIFALDGFRRFKFLAEEYLSSKDENLQTLGEYNGKPVYKANNFITPRYKKEKLKDEVQKNLEAFQDRNAAYFLATFIVTMEGKVENVQIVHGISEGFNNEFTKQLLKTSKDWSPAVFKGQPIQTQMIYQIKYLKSLVPYNSGRLN